MHGLAQPSIEVIRQVNADIVFLQELGPVVAAALAVDLRALYPYQELVPGPGPVGMGLLSKQPLAAANEQLPLDWIGEPQLYQIEWQGETVLLVNFHTYSTDIMPLAPLNANFSAVKRKLRRWPIWRLAALAPDRRRRCQCQPAE